jgi:cation transport protein ChaC
VVKRTLALTPDLLVRAHRPVADSGPDPNLVYYTDEDYRATIGEILGALPTGDDLWLFAYGSLIWKPEMDYLEERMGLVRGWHRAFRLKIDRWRATKDRPGLMMVLDRGGQCRGVLYRIAAATLQENLDKLLRREMNVKPSSQLPRWVTVQTDDGSVQAITFVADPKGRIYAGRLSQQETADLIAAACGHWGSCAEYLHNTVVHLADRGVHDRNLWILQELVAKRLLERPEAVVA